MKKQLEAMCLADALENGECFDVGSTGVVYGWMYDDPTSEAADELRRLHTENERLREENAELLQALQNLHERCHWSDAPEEMDAAKSAIEKAIRARGEA